MTSRAKVKAYRYAIPNTVGIWIPDMSGFRMVKSRSDMKWSGFRTSKCPVFELQHVRFSNDRPIPSENRMFLSGFRMVRAILKPDIKNVRFSNDSGIQMSGFSDCDCNGRKTNTNFIDVTHMTSRTENETKPRDLQKSYPNIIFFYS